MRLPRKRKKQVKSERFRNEVVAEGLNLVKMYMDKQCRYKPLKGKELEAWLKSRSYHE